MDREETLKIYDDAVALCPRFERKGKTMPYTSANGYMFSLLNKVGELGIRFSEKVKAQYITQLKSSNFISHGAVMKGYVLIPEHICSDEAKLVSLLKESYEYVMTLKPK